MSCFYLPKKLKELPSSSKKAWNSLTSSLSPKLRNLRKHTLITTLPKSLTKTATRLFVHRGHKGGRRSIPRRPTRPPSRGARSFYYYKQYNYQHLHPSSSVPNSPATVYVDRLFGESLSSKTAKVGVTTMEEASTSGSGNNTLGSASGGSGAGGGGGAKKRKKKVENSSSWKEYVSSMPNIKGVDERAEEFISKFRQEMQIQREQSIIEFQEMLARSA